MWTNHIWGGIRPNSGRAAFAQIWDQVCGGLTRATSGRIRPTLGRRREIRADVGQTWSRFRPELSRLRPTSAHVRPRAWTHTRTGNSARSAPFLLRAVTLVANFCGPALYGISSRSTSTRTKWNSTNNIGHMIPRSQAGVVDTGARDVIARRSALRRESAQNTPVGILPLDRYAGRLTAGSILGGYFPGAGRQLRPKVWPQSLRTRVCVSQRVSRSGLASEWRQRGDMSQRGRRFHAPGF